MDHQEIEALLRKSVEGCEDSAMRFVQEFESQIRLEIRTRMASSGVGRMVDSVDIAQSVFTNFLIAARTGEISQLDPKSAIALLMRTSREKVAQKIRFHTADKRDIRRDEGAVDLYSDLRSTALGPTERAAQMDLLDFLRSRLGQTDFRLVELRMSGCSWSEVAEQTGMTSDACRMRVQRLKREWPDELGGIIQQPRS